MTYQAVPDTAAFTLELGSATLQWSNTFHGRKQDFSTLDMIGAAEALFDAASLSDYVDHLHTTFYFRKVTAYDLRSDGAPVYVTTAAPVQGVEASPVLPIQDAFVCTLRTFTRGRSGRGRLYFAGFTEGGLSAGQWSTTLSAAILSMMDDIQTALTSLGFEYVLVSRYHDNVKRSVGLTIPIEGVENRSSIPGNQERRSRRP